MGNVDYVNTFFDVIDDDVSVEWRNMSTLIPAEVSKLDTEDACRWQTAAPSPTGLRRSIAPDGRAVTERSEGRSSEAALTATLPAPP